ncbi:2-dehydro-3-deoxygalactonokinase [Rubricella aquisinus]|uniref:2-dehydro-3-deoxygalactonokinase n=1 Tax=Rubricella aquisinus TaxID=2028108 RepID=UPI003CCE3869
MRPDWIAVDWGTSNLRVWAMQGRDVLAARSSDAGMNTLEPGGFEPALLALIDSWLGDGATPVIACGMVGSRQGWGEAPYLDVPTVPTGSPARMPVRDARITVSVLPGIKQADPADVMRGEETQIAGLIAEEPRFDGVVCLPGTHTKWVRISAEEVCHFRTAMTGEMHSLLSKQSVLRHSITADWDDQTFLDAVDEVMSRPERIASSLFSIRAAGLVGRECASPAARLSGILIGAELAAMKPYWLGQDVALIGSDKLCALYAQALRLTGLEARILDATRMTLAGLAAAYEGSLT